MLSYSIVYSGNRRPCVQDMDLDEFFDYLIVKRLIITSWYILPNSENILVVVRKEKEEE